MGQLGFAFAGLDDVDCNSCVTTPNWYNEAINYFTTVWATATSSKPFTTCIRAILGRVQEEGRDQGHSGLEVAMLGVFCSMAYNQGDDLFAYENNRVLSLCEYFAKYNLYNNVPYLTYRRLQWRL